MAENAPRLVSRAQLARYAGVSRAAVTNWRNRGSDFPEPADAERELFDLDQVTGWLSSRAVPANARQPHEPAGTTYADRVRAGMEADAPRPGPRPRHGSASGIGDIDRTVLRLLNDLRGTCEPVDSALLIAVLVFLRSSSADQWGLLRLQTGHGIVDGSVFATDFGDLLPPFVSGPLRELGADAFTTAVQGVDAIDAQGKDREVLLTAFNSALSFLEREWVSAHADLRTPESVVRTMVNLLASDGPFDSVYDPFCRTGEFLTEAVQARTEIDPPRAPHVSGAAPNERVFGIAGMNMLLHGIEADFGDRPGLPWDRDDARATADIVLANPPFNMSGPPVSDSTRESFRYGRPPNGNMNFRWLQHVIDRLSPNGRASVLMANGASLSTNAKEAAIRSNMVEDGAVECLIALPGHLFRSTTIPVTVWMLKAPTGRCEEILFIDAGGLGRMTSRTLRTLQEEDAALIRRAYNGWRDGARDGSEGEAPSISRVATIEEIRDKQYSLHPPIYVSGRAPQTDQGKQAETLVSLIQRLESLQSQIPLIETRTSRVLREAQRWIP
ncbi:N-6 DNA methylase [Nocardiopsis akebiae]|uniref:N-6 DNA methylase n=1 Tax=Nocardiopsis akebiae TaxID=2831968 RepID=A0ABX8C2S3_9ACTN|nr:N-6 DNA methylase [Nocardiopsis akebiae]QUX28225.1 N-6 DNA methylase [Nocardiopsis akebiae]